MEDRVKKYRKQKFIAGLIGVFVGMATYDILGFPDGRISRFFFGVLFSIIGYAIHDLYSHFKYPEMRDTEKLLDKDERNVLVKGRAAYMTVNIALFSLVVPIIVAIIMENQLLAYFSIGLYVFILAVFAITKRYWEKRI